MVARGSVSTILVRPLALALGGEAAALSSFWAATGLTAEALANDDARVSPAQFRLAWDEATRASGDPALGLRLAGVIPTGAFGVVEYVCRSAPTLRDALARWVRYLGLLDDAVDVALVDEGATTALRVVRESDEPAPSSHELCFALLVRHARAIVAAGCRVESVRFAHAAPAAQVALYRAFFAAPVLFEAGRTEVVFGRDTLAAPLLTADPNLLAILAPLAEARRPSGRPSHELTEQVRRSVQAALPGDDAQLTSVARRLGMTGRHLQRRLREEGTSFLLVRDGVRRELADRYLGQGMSLAEISFLLGFSEPSAFFRAFRRWTGMTPLERRVVLSAASVAVR